MIFKAQQDIVAHLAQTTSPSQGPMTTEPTTTPVLAPITEPERAAPQAPSISISFPTASVAPAPTPVAAEPPTDGLTGGTKDDAGKAPWHLLPSEATEEVLKTLDYGAKKYGAFNWVGGFKWGRVFSATLRHLWSWQRGQDNDPETGLSHLAHAAANVLFLLSFVLWRRGEDDRPAAIGAAK